MSVVRRLRRLWRRYIGAAGVDYIYDYEVAALRALSENLSDSDREKLAAQLARYDRIDRSPNKRYQRFIDDDSDFRRSDWPREIIFADEELVHSGDLILKRRGFDRAQIKVSIFLVWGRFDGCEFNRSHIKDVPLVHYPMTQTMSRFASMDTEWYLDTIKLYTPFSVEKSRYKFVPA